MIEDALQLPELQPKNAVAGEGDDESGFFAVQEKGLLRALLPAFPIRFFLCLLFL